MLSSTTPTHTAPISAATSQWATVAPMGFGPPQERASSSVSAPAAQSGYQAARATTNTSTTAAPARTSSSPALNGTALIAPRRPRTTAASHG